MDFIIRFLIELNRLQNKNKRDIENTTIFVLWGSASGLKNTGIVDFKLIVIYDLA